MQVRLVHDSHAPKNGIVHAFPVDLCRLALSDFHHGMAVFLLHISGMKDSRFVPDHCACKLARLAKIPIQSHPSRKSELFKSRCALKSDCNLAYLWPIALHFKANEFVDFPYTRRTVRSALKPASRVL